MIKFIDVIDSSPSQHSTLIYIGPSSARQGSWRADDGPM